MFRKAIGIVLVLALMASGIAGCKAEVSVSQSIEHKMKIVMVFDSPVSDDAFSLSCLKGAETAKQHSGIGLTVVISGGGAETEALIDQLAESRRYDLIIAMGSSQSNAVKKSAVKYKAQKFALVDGTIDNMENVSSLLVRDNESSFLVGALAAMISQNDVIGFIGGMDQPSIQRFLSGYTAGAKYVNPNCQVLTGYSGSWLNDGKTKELAEQQAAEGADVFFGAAGAGSLGVIEYARANGLYAMGVDTDQSNLAPENIPGSALKYVDISVLEAIKLTVSGQFKGGIESVGLKEGGVGIAINDRVEAVNTEIKVKIEEIEKGIVEGKIKVP